MRFPAALLLLLVPAAAAHAQVQVAAAYEVAADQWRYRFENPSSFDTPDLVPHDYEQTYWGDNQWFSLQARYRLGGRLLESEVAFTPERTTRGDDFDTFYQPSGDVVVSGTTGDILLRSWRVGQTLSLGRAAGLAWVLGYRYRRDVSEFLDATKIVTHTQPPSYTETWVTDPETTISSVHEVQFNAGREWQGAGAWTAAASMEISPTTNARLTTRLPLKYPGRDIEATAIVATLRPRVHIAYGRRRTASLTVTYTRTFSYSSARQYEVNALTVAVGAGWASR